MVKPNLPVDIYVRVSRRGKREAQAFGSPEEQVRDALAFADGQRLVVGVELPHDIDQSGGKVERPGFQEALRRIRDGESGGIIVAYQSRYSRDTLSGLQALQEIEQAGGAVYGPNVPDYTTPDGKMMFTINLAIDAGYLDRKAMEFERAKERAIERGIPVSNRPTFGYLRKISITDKMRADDPEGTARREAMNARCEELGIGRQLVPDPDTAPLVVELFQRRAAGAGPTELAVWLNDQGAPTATGGKWSKQSIGNVLASRVYRGEVHWGKYTNPTAHDPIVDEELWQAAQIPTTTRLRPSRAAEPRYLLTGIARCASCGHAMQGTVNGHGVRLYRCTRQSSAGECPAPVSIVARNIEPLAIDALTWIVDALQGAAGNDELPDVEALESAAARAERLWTQLQDPEVQELLGDDYLPTLRTRKQDRERATLALEAGRATVREHEAIFAAQGYGDEITVTARREQLGLYLDAIAVRRREDRSVVLDFYPRGSLPEGMELPKAGYRREPRQLQPFPAAAPTSPGFRVEV